MNTKSLLNNLLSEINSINQMDLFLKALFTNKELKELAERFKNNTVEMETLNKIIRAIQSNYRQSDNDETRKVLSLLESYLIIDKPDSALYKFTTKGKRFLRYINE